MLQKTVNRNKLYQLSTSELIEKNDEVLRKLKQKYGEQHCITCGGNYRLQLGHYVPRTYFNARWEWNNAHNQCEVCNCFRGGEFHIYKNKLIEKFGEKKVRDIEDSKRKLISKKKMVSILYWRTKLLKEGVK